VGTFDAAVIHATFSDAIRTIDLFVGARMPEPVCPKCQSRMEAGFVLDNTYGMVTQAEWAEGEPKYSIWTGIRMKGRERHPVTTYRCPKCAYLESYAREVEKSAGA
jgi:hypothetical protein